LVVHALDKEDEDKTNVLDHEIIGFVMGMPLWMFLMHLLHVPKKRDRIFAWVLRTWDRMKRIDIFELLDSVEEKYTWTLDDLGAALLQAKPRISNLALELAFSEPDWCVPSWRVHVHAFFLGVKGNAVAWWKVVGDRWIIDHGSFRDRNALAVRRMKEELNDMSKSGVGVDDQ